MIYICKQLIIKKVIAMRQSNYDPKVTKIKQNNARIFKDITLHHLASV